MAKIYAPNKEYTGVVAGVPFNKGVGETDEQWLIGWFEEKGYKVEPEETEEEKKLSEEAEAKSRAIDGMTVDELKSYAADNEIDLGEAKLKAEILEIIKGGK